MKIFDFFLGVVEENPCTITCKTSDNRRPSKTLPSVNLFDGTRCSTKTTTGVCYLGNCKVTRCSYRKSRKEERKKEGRKEGRKGGKKE